MQCFKRRLSLVVFTCVFNFCSLFSADDKKVKIFVKNGMDTHISIRKGPSALDICYLDPGESQKIEITGQNNFYVGAEEVQMTEAKVGIPVLSQLCQFIQFLKQKEPKESEVLGTTVLMQKVTEPLLDNMKYTFVRTTAGEILFQLDID